MEVAFLNNFLAESYHKEVRRDFFLETNFSQDMGLPA